MNLSLEEGARRLTACLERVVTRERAVAELRRLDARGLADLGITRADIRAYVNGTMAKPPLPEAPQRLRPILRVIDGGLSTLARATPHAPRPSLRLAASRV